MDLKLIGDQAWKTQEGSDFGRTSGSRVIAELRATLGSIGQRGETGLAVARHSEPLEPRPVWCNVEGGFIRSRSGNAT